MRGAGDLVLDVRARYSGARTTVAVSAWGTVPVVDARIRAQPCPGGQFASGRIKDPRAKEFKLRASLRMFSRA